MQTRDFEILLAKNQIVIPRKGSETLSEEALITLLANLVHYGFALSHQGFEALQKASANDVGVWWTVLEKALKKTSGDDVGFAEFVVYKNFPSEVLSMSESTYWAQQILMYMGLPNHLFSEKEKARAPLPKGRTLKVLQSVDESALGDVYRALCKSPARLTPGQLGELVFLAPRFYHDIPLEKVAFKENQVLLACELLKQGVDVTFNSATDVLRFCFALSGGDCTLRENAKLKNFARKERRAILQMLESQNNLREDAERRREKFKRLMYALKPGDYATHFPKVCAVYDALYRDQKSLTFNRQLESALKTRDVKALALLKTRPGEFMRRLRHCIELFGSDAAEGFYAVVPALKTIQLLKLVRYLETEPTRKTRAIAPQGNWSKLRVDDMDAGKRLPQKISQGLVKVLQDEIATRVSAKVPSVSLDEKTRFVKLKSNDGDLTPYGRGTVFELPEDVSFLRTASYWATGKTRGNIWYDNGWNFFDEGWKPLGACCWTNELFALDLKKPEDKKSGPVGAVFSGDPTNSKDLEGRACQMIDLYLEALAQQKVRYAVWNILCYSKIAFDKSEVWGALQWGKDPAKGKLFEPARCQLMFPVGGPSFTKYVALLDVKERTLTYLDANLNARVSSAASNGGILEKVMPAFVEYLESMPSVFDVFRHVPKSKEGTAVLYSDSDAAVKSEQAFVFLPANEESAFTPLELSDVLS